MQGRERRLTSKLFDSEQLQRLRTRTPFCRQPTAPSPGATSSAPLLTEQEVLITAELIDVVRRARLKYGAPLQRKSRTCAASWHGQQETSNAFSPPCTRRWRDGAGLAGHQPRPTFISWVSLPEVYSGVIRQQLMQEAWNNGDALRVAAFFRAFLQEAAAVDPRQGYTRAASPPTMVPRRARRTGMVPLATRLSLDQLAAPGRAHSGTQQLPVSLSTRQRYSRSIRVRCGNGGREADRAAIDATS